MFLEWTSYTFFPRIDTRSQTFVERIFLTWCLYIYSSVYLCLLFYFILFYFILFFDGINKLTKNFIVLEKQKTKKK